MALQITDGNLNEVLSTNELVMVDFFADWCGPCKILGPVVDELSNEITDVAIGKLNVSDNPEKSAEYGVTSIPCLIFFKNGKEVDRVRGVLPKSALRSKIDGLKN